MDEIAIILILILLNGIFAMSEIAVISARKSSLSTDLKKGSKSAKMALKLANDPDPLPLHGANRHHAHRYPDGYLLRSFAGPTTSPTC